MSNSAALRLSSIIPTTAEYVCGHSCDTCDSGAAADAPANDGLVDLSDEELSVGSRADTADVCSFGFLAGGADAADALKSNGVPYPVARGANAAELWAAAELAVSASDIVLMWQVVQTISFKGK